MICSEPGCPTIVRRGYCSVHERAADHRRGSAQQRGYDARWRALSAAFRRQHPLCGERHDGTMDTVNSRCARDGRTTAAECVDHVIPIRDGGARFDPRNLMSACLACNTLKANTIERPRRGGDRFFGAQPSATALEADFVICTTPENGDRR